MSIELLLGVMYAVGGFAAGVPIGWTIRSLSCRR